MQTRLKVINSIMMAYRAQHPIVYVQSNNAGMVHEVLNLLTNEGFIEG
jgi:hypothetical protein